MKTINAKFIASSEKLSQCPSVTIEGRDVIELAFIGRSNVGKSSLINAIAGNASLAKVSGTPGKTRLINHFLMDDAWYLVDLPGYGYAKASKSMRAEFGKLIRSYILNRTELYCLFVLIDIRHEPQKIDVEFMEFLGENGVPFVMVFTKGDKISATARKKSVENYSAKLGEHWEALPTMFVTSAETKMGLEPMLEYIEAML